MRQLTDTEVQGRAEQLTKRHRSEWARLVYEACVGRSISQVAELLGRARIWVKDHLDAYAVETVQTQDGAGHPPLVATRDEVRSVVRDYAPEEPDEDYVAEYEAEGYSPEVAKRLARTYEAGENALDAGVLEETVTDGKSSSRINLPTDADWAIRLRRAVSDVRAAAGLLDRARISDLRRAETRRQVAIAHAAWMEQIERIENFHPTFREEVAK